jgi:uncharacterized protein YkwD
MFTDAKENTPEWSGFSKHGQALKEKKQYNNADAVDGIHSYVGKGQNKIIKEFGEPDRIDPSAYDYDTWIYNNNNKEYMQVGIVDKKVVSIYVLGEGIEMGSLEIGQGYDELKKKFDFSVNTELKTGTSTYQFQLKESELESKPLVKFEGNVNAQLYFDTFTGELSSVRFIDNNTLVKHRPYDFIYRGELVEASSMSEQKSEKIREGYAKQVFEITNVIRERYDVELVEWDEKTAAVALGHSKEMFDDSYFSHTSPTKGDLSERLKRGDVYYLLAGENIAAKYVDAVSVVVGWLNSEGHRKTLLNEEFTHLGVGVYKRYYTQNFVQIWNP